MSPRFSMFPRPRRFAAAMGTALTLLLAITLPAETRLRAAAGPPPILSHGEPHTGARSGSLFGHPDRPLATVAVTYDGVSRVYDPNQSAVIPFQVQNTGSGATGLSYAVSCSGSGFTVTSCGGAITGPTSLAAGELQTVYVSFNSSLAGGTASMTLVVSDPATSVAFGSVTASATVLASPSAVTVTSDGVTRVYSPNASDVVPFQVHNAGSTTAPISFAASCRGAGFVNYSCGGTITGASMLAPGETQNVRVSFNTSVGGGTGVMTLIATNPGTGAVYGTPLTRAMVLNSPPAVAVSYDGMSRTYSPNQSATVPFQVRNTTGSAASVAYAASCTGPGFVTYSCGGAITGPSTLAAGEVQPVQVSFNASVAGGAATMTLIATNPATGATYGTPTASVTVALSTAPGARTPATLDLRTNPGDYQDPSKCVMDCFENVFTYSMPGYVSRDADRGVTLVYRSGRAHPIARIALAVSDTSLTLPANYSLKVRKGDGSFVTFLNGRTELLFQRSTSTSLVGEFDVSGMSTRRLNYTAVVTSYWSDGSPPLVSTAAAPVLVVNEDNSPYGAGIGIAGVQRFYVNPEPEGGLIMTEGAGGATWFAGSCASTAVGCSFVSPAGDFSTMSVDNTGYVRRYPDGTRVTYGWNGYHYQTIDRFGGTTTYSYVWSASSNAYTVAVITDPAGITTEFGYSDGSEYWLIGKLHWIRQNVGSGRTAAFGVDPTNNLQHWLDVDGIYYGFAAYDGAAHRMTHFTDRAGNGWDFTYSPVDGTLSQMQAPYTDLGNGGARPTTNIVAPTVAASAALASAPDAPVSATLDRRGSVTNPRGYATYYTVNGFGSARTTTDAIGRTSYAYYNADGLPYNISPAAGVISAFEWDGPRVTRVTQGPSDIHYAYNTLFSQVDSVWGTMPKQVFTYNASLPGRPLLTARTIAAPADVVTTFSFTSDGRMQTQIDVAGHGDTLAYGSPTFQNLSTVTQRTASGSKVTQLAYDAFGRPSTVTDPTGAVATSSYDLRNLVTRTVGARGDSTRMYYDRLGNDTLVVDARGAGYLSFRNVLGWVRAQQDPRGQVTWFTYDVNGNVTASANRRNQASSATYDALDRVATATRQADNQTTSYAYDPAGLWAAVSSGTSTDTVRLNADRQVVQQQTARPGYSRSVRASYDGMGQRTGVNVLRNGAPVPADTVAYSYTSAGELAWIVDAQSNYTHLTYDSDHLLKWTEYAGGAYAANTYSSSHALIGRTYPNTPDLDAAFGRTYVIDSVSRVHESRRGDVVRRYAYDPSGELTNQVDWQRVMADCTTDPDYGVRCAYTGEVPVTGSFRSYSYDLVGNPTDTGTTIAGGNRLTRFAGDSILYDLDGNVVQRYRLASPSTFNQVLTWNSANQLTAVATTRNGATTTLQFGYDGSGRRIRKTVVGGSTTDYVWDGDQIVAETDPSGVTQRLYTYFPGTDQLNSVVANGQTYYAAQDAAGNVIGMIDRNTMSAKDTYRYQPFGTMDQNDQNVPTSLRWKGLLYDAESGLYYMRARYYAPEMRRFLSEDPIGLEGGINPYRFAGNAPVNGTDPSGRCGWTATKWNGGDVIGWDYEWCPFGPPGGYALGPIYARDEPSWDPPPSERPATMGPGPSLGNPHYAPVKNLSACSAAAVDASIATAGDLLSLTGFGMIATRGTRGARIGIKVLRASEWLIQDRLTGALTPSNSGSARAISKWSANVLIGRAWSTASSAAQGEALFDWQDELLSLIPVINSGRKIYKAVQRCF
jgi:RHS repeat-associated protein